ncbi:60s acidic ribosomal protein [Spraguea lophii 42_110]|uniref:60s acidic ribosomal protein n=1 Tax=Spraguea lophii (strain 42_110) TaxID=1358809 RepID=S7W9Q8_SPRLO|nr:60s acidic ribosomal protein [Spraguea lophii 42_110]
MAIVFSELYSKAALFIYSCGLEVTSENMKGVFEQMGVEFNKKVAEMFIFPNEKYDELVSSVSAPSAVSAGAGASNATEAKEDEPKQEEKAEEDVDVDFGDLFA